MKSRQNGKRERENRRKTRQVEKREDQEKKKRGKKEKKEKKKEDMWKINGQIFPSTNEIKEEKKAKSRKYDNIKEKSKIGLKIERKDEDWQGKHSRLKQMKHKKRRPKTDKKMFIKHED